MGERKPRVLIIVSGMDVGGANGGADKFGIELSRYLDSNLFDILLCSFWRRGGKTESYWYKILKEAGVNVIFAAERKGKFELPEYIRGLRYIARQISTAPVDIIHSNFQMGTVAALLLKAFGYTRKTMRTAHGFHEWGDGIIAFILRLVFQNWVYPLFLDAEVGVSQATVQELSGYTATRLWRKHPQLIYNAISPEVFENKENNQTVNMNAKAEAGIIVGSIGRMTRQKGYIYLLQAIPRIISKVPGVKFVLAGDGDLLNDLKQTATETGIRDKVQFLGQCDQVLPLLRQMDLFVLPSLWEGLPTVVLESMACGVPVVATDILGTRELIQSGVTGWLVPPGDSLALSETIIMALKSPMLRADVAIHASEIVKAFSFSYIAREYQDLYLRISS
jgi:glycosyltransferase involved in cell wall biosynthesis